MSFFKNIPYELVLGWRYTRAGRATRRNGFISFISGVSMMGIGLGVAALIIVLSVMNGFQKEVRDRMLGVVSHIEVYAVDGAAVADLPALLARLKANPQVLGAAPFITAQALLARGEDMKGVLVRGIDPALEPEVSDLSNDTQAGVLQRLQPGEFSLVLGRDLDDPVPALGGTDHAPQGGDFLPVQKARGDTIGRNHEVLDQLRQRNPTLTMPEFIAEGSLDEVVKQMIDRFAVGQYGKDYGLRAGENLVNSEILQIQAFQGLTGQFDQQTYLAAIGQRGLTDATFRRDLAIDLIEQQLLRSAEKACVKVIFSALIALCNSSVVHPVLAITLGFAIEILLVFNCTTS